MLHSFDGADAGAIGLQRGNQAGVHQLAVHKNCAGTALAFAAAFFRAGQMQVLAEYVEQPLHRWNIEALRLAVDGELNQAHAFTSVRRVLVFAWIKVF